MRKKEEEKYADSNWMEGMPSISAVLKGIEAGSNTRRILRILVDESRIKQKRHELGFLRVKAKQHGFELKIIDPQFFEQWTLGNTHGGIIAECTERELPSLSPDMIAESGVYFILEGVEDPYNFGYAVRSLYAAGADGVILSPRNWMGAAGVVARSSAGASELMDMYVSDPVQAIPMFRAKGYRVLCAGIRDSVSLFDTDLNKPLLVVLGGEKRGISRSVLEMADETVRIDYGVSFQGSLSTAAAAAVFAFEILRCNR
ncbi:MAG: RNA methyltransferase [Clostridia bacterium]|nr:RNA methyltransferase [Clostridia bacterium]